MFADLIKAKWKYVVLGLAAPALLLLVATKARAPDNPYTPVNNNPSANLRAFLTMIQYAEGTYGKDAYRVLFGGGLFTGYNRHPDIAITRSGYTSTAAGAYQILFHTWVTIQLALGLQDFSPPSQDKAAIELVRRRGALEDVLAGRLETAVEKCRKEWASLPGAGYGQREQSFAILKKIYLQAGGQIA
jgi:muramidase (phage lysozyme)